MVAPATAAAVFGQLDGAPLPVAARGLARAGVPVFPSAPAGKRPIPERGFHEASVDLDRVEGGGGRGRLRTSASRPAPFRGWS